MIAGYSVIEQYGAGERFVMYRARNGDDGTTVLIKASLTSTPDGGQSTTLKHEFRILEALPITGVAKPRELVTRQRDCLLILEDNEGVPLATVLKSGALDVSAALQISIRLASVLIEIHGRGLSCLSVNSDSVFIRETDAELQLVDFSRASRSDGRGSAAAFLTGNDLCYMSPEQTGRMNRHVDYRSDLYSLGVLLYEMLTGAPPFKYASLIELIHAHIARTPIEPCEVNPSIPKPISQIVMKLLEKTARARYQSAVGACADLQRCADQLSSGTAITPFELGHLDVLDRFLLPQHLYGRKQELQSMLQAFERTCQGHATLMFVTGYSGVGKTTLVRELYSTIASQDGMFIAGKCDQLERSVPYHALLQAFGQLVQRLLIESADRLLHWRGALTSALGSNTSVLAKLLPEFELIVGPQPSPAELPAAEARNRLRIVLEKFLRVLAAPDRPLVVFLDDLQWIDSATLELLQHLLSGSSIRGLMIVGAYRDNEVGDGHPLMQTQRELRKNQVTMHTLTLAPLPLNELNELVSDSLHCNRSAAQPLAELLQTKTDGNPFFVCQFLQTLYLEGFITFDDSRNCWQYDAKAVADVPITDNVVDLMSRRILQLEPATQQALVLAAMIGARFELKTLATISETEASVVQAYLQPALDAGLILDMTARSAATSYEFLHDRLQQAAYAMVLDEGRPQLHLKIGRLLRESHVASESGGEMFEIVRNLNLGAELIEDADERSALARLNLAAAIKAKSSAAWQAALGYLNNGIKQLDDLQLQADYELRFSLEIEAAECEYLCGMFDVSERHFDRLLEFAQSALDKARVFRLRIAEHELLGKYAEAARIGTDGAAMLGIEFPQSAKAAKAAIATEFESIERLLAGRSIASLIDLPIIDDPEKSCAISLLTDSWSAAYISGNDDLSALISARIVRLSIKYGCTADTSYGYVTHAITAGPGRGDYQAAYEWGLLALATSDRFGDMKGRAKIHQQFNAHVTLWRKPLESCVFHAREASRIGLENGDFAYAGYGAFTESWPKFLLSQDLKEFVRDLQPNLGQLLQVRMTQLVGPHLVMLNWARALMGVTDHPLSLAYGEFGEEAFIEKSGGNPFFMTVYLVAKLHLAVNFEDYEAALGLYDRAQDVGWGRGTIWPVIRGFWGGLAVAAAYPQATPQTRKKYWAQLTTTRRMLDSLADNCAENFRCYALLLASEMARLKDDDAGALELLDQAVRFAGQTTNVQLLALAQELSGRLWLLRGNDTIAGACLGAAVRLYEELGAATKVRQLEQRYPRLHLTDSYHRESSLDIESVIKAARAISADITVLDELLEKLVSISLENAGASTAILLLEHNGELTAVAQASVAGSDDESSVEYSDPIASSYARSVVNYVMNSKAVIITGNAQADERFVDDPYVVFKQPRSILCLPLLLHGNLIGVFYLENNLADDAFTEDRVELMSVLGVQAAISLENARLYDEMKKEVEQRRLAEERERMLLEINNAIISNLSRESLLHAVSEAIRRAVKFERSAIFLDELPRNVLRLQALESNISSTEFTVGYEMSEEESGSAFACRAQQYWLRCNLASEREHPTEEILWSEGIRSLCAAPLVVRDRTIGILIVMSEVPNQYSETDAEFLHKVASQVSIAIANMQSFTEIEALKARLEAENVYLQEEIREAHHFDEIVGNSPLLLAALAKVEMVAATDATVLVHGETGTGKELFARAVHESSNRSGRPMVKVNCAAISAGLVESELFGHVKGAFTGAVGKRVGRFELADGGTIFLDEVGDLPAETQVKLLRVLQEQEFEPVGDSRSIHVDVRVIAATNRNLEKAVAAGTFRSDLYYRLQVFPIVIPPLRERSGDVARLAMFFLARFAKRFGKDVDRVDRVTMRRLQNYSWPGNVRELQNVIERGVIMTSGVTLSLDPEFQALLPSTTGTPDVDSPADGAPDSNVSAKTATPASTTLAEIERHHILTVLESTGGVIEGPQGAAKRLDLSPSTLRFRMKKLGINR